MSTPTPTEPTVPTARNGGPTTFPSVVLEVLREMREQWAAAGFKDTLLRWKMEPEVQYGNETAVQPGVQA